MAGEAALCGVRRAHARATAHRSAPETRRGAARAPYPAVQHRAGAVRPAGRGARRAGERPAPIFRHSSNDARPAGPQTATPHLDSGGFMRRSLGVRVLGAGLLASLMAPAVASADLWESGSLQDSVGINTMWVFVAAVLVIFMQAGFMFLEIGFSRGKNAGTIVAKILTNFSIAAIMYWAVGFAFAFGGPLGHVIGDTGFFLRDYGDPADRVPGHGLLRRLGRGEVPLPVRVLRRVAGDRLGHDARADQVRRLHHLRDRLLRADLPDRLALGLRRRLAAGQRRHAGLRRLDGRPPHRRDRRPRGAAAARRPQGQVRAGRQAAGDPGAQHAAVRPRRAASCGSAGSGSTRARR